MSDSVEAYAPLSSWLPDGTLPNQASRRRPFYRAQGSRRPPPGSRSPPSTGAVRLSLLCSGLPSWRLAARPKRVSGRPDTSARTCSTKGGRRTGLVGPAHPHPASDTGDPPPEQRITPQPGNGRGGTGTEYAALTCGRMIYWDRIRSSTAGKLVTPSSAMKCPASGWTCSCASRRLAR